MGCYKHSKLARSSESPRGTWGWCRGWLATCSPQPPAHCAVLAWELGTSLENSVLKLFSPVELVCNWLILIKYCINHITCEKKVLFLWGWVEVLERFSEGLPLNKGLGVTPVNRIGRWQSLKARRILHLIAFQVSLKVSSLLTEKLGNVELFLDTHILQER